MVDVTQICYASWDIEAAAKTLVEIERAGPFFFAEFPLDCLQYRGEEVDYGRLKVGFGYRGRMQIELIQAPAGMASCYAEVLGDGKREAFHHVYIKSDDDYDAIVERHARAGEPMVYHGLAGDDGIRFGFIDARPRLGHFVEVLETNRMVGKAAAIYGLYAKMEQAAVDWDGSRPLRSIGELV